MATPIQGNKTPKEASSKWARLRQVATEEPKRADEAIAELAEALGTMADSLNNLRTNLDLVESPKTANIKARIQAARKYAAKFRHMANEAPEVVADALSEVYHSLDDVAGAVETLAENLGIELSLTPAEAAFGEEGKKELEGEWGPEEPESGAEPEVDEEKFEEGEEELESPEAAQAEENLDEEIDKEAAGTDFTTDRDEQGEPKTPVLAAKKDEKARKCPECKWPGATVDPDGTCRHCKKKTLDKAKKADAAAFVTDRGQDAKPESPEKIEAPEAQGETEVGKSAARREQTRQRIAKRNGIEL